MCAQMVCCVRSQCFGLCAAHRPCAWHACVHGMPVRRPVCTPSSHLHQRTSMAAVIHACINLVCMPVSACRAYPLYDTQGKPGWDLEQSREKGLYAAAVAIGWGSQVSM